LDGADPGGTPGLVFGVFGVGFEDGGAGTSGDEVGIDGDTGGGGVCVVQPTARALSAMAASMDKLDLVACILHLQRKFNGDYSPARTPESAAIA
jgi:hypothetical protein